jgi:dienelactone hydrolase
MRRILCLFACLIVAETHVAVSAAEMPRFRVHILNADSEFSAAAALDVDSDGKLDVVSGGWWYEAPTWKKRFLRDVTRIRGRFDDYSNLPLDVNGDGRLDLVSANYRSQSIFWVENPGKAGAAWTTHKVAQPGAMETGRLADVDGDGRLDVLPNGTKFAAWWSVERDSGNVVWKRHPLPEEAAGHGVGYGDVDGDGRGDLVNARGWFKAPEDPRTERWTWQPEFELHRDCSIPIEVRDVDNDGDADVIWARGHKTGLYWLEQVKRDGKRSWTMHAIDTSIAQAHALLVGDLDGDGRPELIAGKRYLGHDGKDLGEWDPMFVAAYFFDSKLRTWHKSVLSTGGVAGFDLDPKIVDLDGDGDLDVLCPTRHGLSWLENLRGETVADNEAAPRSIPAVSYPDHSKLLVVRDAEGRESKVATYADWGRRRAHVLANVERVMGPLPGPSRRVPLDVQVLSEEPTEHYVRRKITYAAEPGDRVPAYLLIPHESGKRRPAMLCLHQTTKIGKDEPAGLGGRPTLHYAHELANQGYVCLVPDYPSFGDYHYDFATKGKHNRSGSMKAIWNNIRGVDLLESLPEVDRDRIGCIGHSLGGHNAIFTAVFDQRIAAVVTSCGFTAFHDYYGGKLAGWTSARYMPAIAREYGSDPDRVPFDFYELIAAIAPRGFYSNSPTNDSNFDVAGVRKIESAVEPIYALTASAGRGKGTFVITTPEGGHDFSDAARRKAYAWLAQQLQ